MNFDTLQTRNVKHLPDGSTQVDIAYGLTAFPGTNPHAADLPSLETIILPPETRNVDRLADLRASGEEVDAWLAERGGEWNVIYYVLDRLA